MAIYHFSGTVVSRSQGRSAVASASYRSAEKLRDDRQDKVYDYTKKQDVIYKEILLPDGAPKWMGDREKLWNAVELNEKRKDAQLAREFNFALPRELSREQNIELAREFVKAEFVDRGMVADLCIHEGKSKDGKVEKGELKEECNNGIKNQEKQPHAHVLLTMREVTEDGFGMKERSWNDKANIALWREAWADCVNKHLALNGIDQRVDHRTLAEQGIDLEPQKKIGNLNVQRIQEERLQEHQNIARENGNKLFNDPQIALDAITKNQSTFTHQDLARFVNRHTADVEQFQAVYEKVKTSEYIIYLGMDDNNRERFTTQDMLDIEKKMLSESTSLESSLGHEVKQKTIDSVIEKAGKLSEEQREGLKHIVDAGDLKCLVGYAGTGKGFVLNEAREIWEKDGYRVLGAALSGIAAEGLEGSSGIESRTLASRSYYWDRGEHLSKKDILVVDEAGMIGSRQMSRIVSEVNNAGAKLVLIGDPQQLQAIEAGASFRAISEQTGYLEFTEVRRQHEPGQQQATKELATRHTQEALERYSEHSHVHEFQTQAYAKMALVEMWNDVRISNPETTQIMLAYTKKDVQELNEMARDLRRENKELGEDYKIQTNTGSKDFAINDRIYFLQNNRDMGVMNGTLGTIEKIKENQLTIKLDKDDLNGRQTVVKFNTENYNHITHGYAATIHKAQGATVDRSYVLATKHFDSHATYVSMSRHRDSADLFWSKEEFANMRDLAWSMGRDRSKDISLDYKDEARDFAKQLYIESPTTREIISAHSLETAINKKADRELLSFQKNHLEANEEPKQVALSRNAELVMNAYIDKQVKLNELIQNKNANLARNPSAARLYAQEAVSLDKNIDEFARQAMKNAEFKKEFDQYDQNKAEKHYGRKTSLAECGGWSGLKDRQKQNQLTAEDRGLVSRHLQNRVESQALERQLTKDLAKDRGRER